MAKLRGAYRRPAAEPVLDDYLTGLSASDLVDVGRACDRFLEAVENGTRRTRSKREELRQPFTRKRQHTPTPSIDGLLRFQNIREFRADQARRLRALFEIYPHLRNQLDPCLGYEAQIISDVEREPAKPRKRRAKAAKAAQDTTRCNHAKDGTDAPQANVVSIMGNTDPDQLNGQTFAGNNDFGND